MRLFFYTFLLPLPLLSATVSVPSTEWYDVSNSISAATDYDILNIPPGTSSWPCKVPIGKSLTIRGAGQWASGQFLTFITNGIGNVNVGCFDVNLTTAGQNVRITQMGFDGNTNDPGTGIYIESKTNTFTRVDHCYFQHCQSYGILIQSASSNLVDNCTFKDCLLSCGSQAGTERNYTWSLPTTVGTLDANFFESLFSYYTEGGWYPGTTGFVFLNGNGGRAVYRHCIVSNFSSRSFQPIIDLHGNNAPIGLGTSRGTRQVELYNCLFWSTNSSIANTLYDYRGSFFLSFSNDWIGHFYARVDAREEDGGYINPVTHTNIFGDDQITNYPASDTQLGYFWTNNVNGTNVSTLSKTYPWDDVLIIVGTNIFFQPYTSNSYAPAVYPHPVVTAQDGRNLHVTNLRVQNAYSPR